MHGGHGTETTEGGLIMFAVNRTRVATAALLLALAGLALIPALAAAAPRTAAAADWESYAIKSDHTLWAWGGNAFGGLGQGNTVPQGVPVQVGTDADWKSVAHGNSLGTVALKSDGSLWHWGDLGIPFTTSPQQYTGGGWTGASWDDFAVGDMHGLLLKDGGELWAWGNDEWGQLGDGGSGSSAGEATPERIGADLWQSVAAGYAHSLGVKTDGTLWAWGKNDYGQLGLGDTTDRYIPTQVGSKTDWAAVFATSMQSFAIDTAGRLYAWGFNEFGQLGVGDKDQHLSPASVGGTGWASVAPGPLTGMALKTDGSLWGWGYNANGQVGLPPDYADHLSPERVGTATIWKDAACGAYHSIAVTTDDRFAACGSNSYGQVGLGYPTYRCSPEQIGTTAGWAQVDVSLTHTAGIRTDGTLWTWGNNGSGQLGYSDGTGIPTQVGYDTDWRSVSVGSYLDGGYTAAIKTGGTLWTWGENSAGELGLGDTSNREVPTQVGPDTHWKDVACSDGVGNAGRVLQGQPFTLDDHTLALKDDGTLWAWGANDYGQLGLGDQTARHEPTQIGTDRDWAAIAVGDDYSAALTTDGRLYTWGRDEFGQLGHGGTPSDTAMALAPTQVGTTERFASIACGSGRDACFMLAVRDDGTLWGWGTSAAGELGLGLSGFGTYSTPQLISAATDWRSVMCGGSFGDNFGLALKDSGQLWSWGGDFRGQLGNADYVSVYSPQATTAGHVWAQVAAGSNSFGIDTDGNLWAWGDDEYGGLGLGDPTAYWSTTVYAIADIVDTVPPAVSGSTTAGASSASRAEAQAAAPTAGPRASGGWSKTPRTIKVSATDAGSGVSRAQISVNGGVSYLTRSKVTVSNGDFKVYCRAIDRMGNRSTPKYLGHFRIDTTKPRPAALGASVKRGARVSLRYRIADYSPCTVRVAVKNAHGVTVKTITVKGARPMSWLKASFRCTLAKGKYRFSVTATDSVGYKSVKAAVGKLVVK